MYEIVEQCVGLSLDRVVSSLSIIAPYADMRGSRTADNRVATRDAQTSLCWLAKHVTVTSASPKSDFSSTSTLGSQCFY